MEKEQNFLGLDWGASIVGLAVAAPETRLALSLMTLNNDATLLEHLGEIIKKENIGTVIVGIPTQTNRPETVYPGENLGEQLVARFGVAIKYQDEMFTTKMAQYNLIERGMRNVSQHDDAEAARIILQMWLDQKAPRS